MHSQPTALQGSQDVGPSRKRARYDVATSQGQHREIGLMRKDAGPHSSSSFLGSSSGIYFVQSVYRALQNGAQPVPVDDNVPGEDDRLTTRRTTDIWTTTEVSDHSRATFEQLKDLSDEYFDHWHAAFPFLLGSSVLEVFAQLADTPLRHVDISADADDLAIVRSILSISAVDRRQCGVVRARPVPRRLLFSSYTHAIDSVQKQLSTPASLRSLQAVLAVQLFLISMLRHNAAMRLGGLAVRMVFQLGLHRCPARYAAFKPDEVQLRKRVFWTAYCLDRMLCQSLGLPLSIRDDDIDVCLFDWEKHGASLTVLPLDPRLAALHLLAKRAEIKGTIMELCNKNVEHRPVDPRARADIEAAMARWQDEMNRLINLSPANESFQKSCKAVLETIRFECIIALSRPLLALPKDTKDYREALQTCLNAARAIIISLHSRLLTHLAKLASRDAGKALTPLFWPSFTWMVWISAFIILYAAVEQEVPLDAAKQLVQKGIDVLEHLSSRNTYWPGVCAVAIRELSTRLDVASQHSDWAGNGMFASSSDQRPLDMSIDYKSDGFPWDLDPSQDPIDVGLFDGFDIPFWLGDDQYSGIGDFWNADIVFP